MTVYKKKKKTVPAQLWDGTKESINQFMSDNNISLFIYYSEDFETDHSAVIEQPGLCLLKIKAGNYLMIDNNSVYVKLSTEFNEEYEEDLEQ